MTRFAFFARALTVAAAALALPGCIIVADDPFYGASTYDTCNFSDECGVIGDACYDIAVNWGSHTAVNGMCTHACASDFDCQNGGACYSVTGSQYLCYQRCGNDWDCEPGFVCTGTVGGFVGDAICLPR